MNGPGALSRSYNDSDSDSLDDRPDNVVNEPFDNDYERASRDGPPQNDSQWIHRDKLVKIENEELQAAGIILPQPRSRSRPGRDRSQGSTNRLNLDYSTRSRKNSSNALEPKTPDTTDAINGYGWERDPDDMDAEPTKPAGGSRIPVPKKSPLPLPTQHQERDKSFRRGDSPDEMEKPKARSRSNSTTLKSLEGSSPHPKIQPGKRAATTTDTTSSKKPTPTGPRKGLPPSKTIPPEARGRVKPKGKNGANGNTRPSTRSGDRELSSGSLGSKPMEGDPPWMVSAYKPDPRLPPDQQLLPTVARRLQQEKWEQEGKFGNIYDKDFRPLTDEGFTSPPSNMPSSSSSDNIVRQEVEVEMEPEMEPEMETEMETETDKPADSWPLKSPDLAKNPASPAKRSSSYSTMPRLQDNPHVNPLPSPRAPTAPAQAPEPITVTRVPDLPEEKETGKKEKGGCGCCIVM